MDEGIKRLIFTVDCDESEICFYESEIDLDKGYYGIDIIGGELIYGID